MNAIRKRYKPIFWGLAVFLVWVAIHVPAMRYGTADLPLHQSYIGDEQSPVNGALHILQDKSPWGFRNLPTVYYGPVFSVVALPAVVVDFAAKYLKHAIHGANDYKDYILWNWGGILWKARLISIITGFIALWALYALLMTVTVNPNRRRSLALIGVALLAFNFYFFEYSSFFRHWIYVVAGLILQIYLLVRTIENREYVKRYYFWQGVIFVGTFGISYLSVLSQIIFLPALIKWYREKDKQMLRAFWIYVVCLVVPLVLVIYWHPRSFIRLINLTGGDATGTGFNGWTSEPISHGFSFGYYAEIIFNNHLALLGLWVMMLVIAVKKKQYRQYAFWLPISVAVFYYLIFGIMGHHEGRYILPVIVAMCMSTAMLFIANYSEMSRRLKTASIVLIAMYLAFHLISLYFWERVMVAGPVERQAIASALAYQSSHPNAKQLVVEWYLLGYPHTKASYQDYLSNYILSRSKNTTGGDLYNAMLAAQYPPGITPLNVFEMHPDVAAATSTAVAFKKYDRVVVRHEPSIDDGLPPDFLEVDLTRYWLPGAWSDSFTTVKQN